MLDSQNLNQFGQEPERYPVESSLPIRYGDKSFIVFEILASGPVAPGDVIELQAPAGYRFTPDYWELKDISDCPVKAGVMVTAIFALMDFSS